MPNPSHIFSRVSPRAISHHFEVIFQRLATRQPSGWNLSCASIVWVDIAEFWGHISKVSLRVNFQFDEYCPGWYFWVHILSSLWDINQRFRWLIRGLMARFDGNAVESKGWLKAWLSKSSSISPNRTYVAIYPFGSWPGRTAPVPSQLCNLSDLTKLMNLLRMFRWYISPPPLTRGPIG